MQGHPSIFSILAMDDNNDNRRAMITMFRMVMIMKSSRGGGGRWVVSVPPKSFLHYQVGDGSALTFPQLKLYNTFD